MTHWQSIVRVFVPAVLALGIAGQAGAREMLVETEYPGPTATVPAATTVASNADLYLIQSNSEGPRENPAVASAMTASRTAPEVRADATIALPYGPGLNA